MQYGFHLYIDEAGDEGVERIRPLDPDGASEYFVMCGVLIRAHRSQELASFVLNLKKQIGLSVAEELHFRDLTASQQKLAIAEIGRFQLGLVAIVSNKRNMRRYRNRRIEQKAFEIVRGKKRPQQYNWFYNHTFRYLLERSSSECARWTKVAFGNDQQIRVIFSQRRGFRYSQTKAYLHKMRVAQHDRSYFNNKRQIDWRVVNPSAIEWSRGKSEPGLQVADCVASAVFRAIDEDWFGAAEPGFLETLSPRFIREGTSPRDYGFKLLPDSFEGPLSTSQKKGLRAVGHHFANGD
jgi:hypothetical protein